MTSEQVTREELVLINILQSNTKRWKFGCFFVCLLLCSGLTNCFFSHYVSLGFKEKPFFFFFLRSSSCSLLLLFQSETHMYVSYFSVLVFILFYFIFSSTSLLLPTYLPPPSCTYAQSCNPMDFSPPDSSVHGFFQARILEWVAISFSKCIGI